MNNLNPIRTDILLKFKEFFNESCGLIFQTYREQHLQITIQKRMRSLKIKSPIDYLEILKKSIKLKQKSNTEFDKLITRLTVNETSFFRDKLHFNYFKDKIMPELIAKPVINIASCGCSTGEEIFSLAMILYDKLGFSSLKKINLLGYDIDKKMLSTIMNKEYNIDSRKITNVPAKYLEFFFRIKDNKYILTDDIKNKVVFRYHNLIKDNFEYKYDVIFCKNVLFYFSDNIKQKILKKIYKGLTKNGYFFTGTTEIIDISKINFLKVSVGGKKGMYVYKKNLKIDKGIQTVISKDDIKNIEDNKNYEVYHMPGHIEKNDDSREHKKFESVLNKIIDSNFEIILMDFNKTEFVCYESLRQLNNVVKHLKKKKKNIAFLIKNKKLKECFFRRKIKVDCFLDLIDWQETFV